MKNFSNVLRNTLKILTLMLVGLSNPAIAGLWNSGYYAGWTQWSLPPSEIDYTAMTHLIHFAAVPRADGTLDTDSLSLSAAHSADTVSRAHAAGTPVILSIGGANSAEGFHGAASDANRAVFIANLVDLMRQRGYDGLDIDWEPIDFWDGGLYATFIQELRAALDPISPRPLLTAATAWHPSLYAGLHQYLDQINLMTYINVQPSSTLVTWFNSPIYDGGFRNDQGWQIYSIDSMVNQFTAAGVPPAKLGIGIDFSAHVWVGGEGTLTEGVSLPRQSWLVQPFFYSMTYDALMTYCSVPPFVYGWDETAQSAYYSLDQLGSVADFFISFDDARAIQARADYARGKGLGGFILWELAAGYRAGEPSGSRNPLLQASYEAIVAPGRTEPEAPAEPTPQIISITPTSSSVVEGGSRTISVKLSAPATVPISIPFSVSGAGTAGIDYTTASSPLEIPVGAISRNFRIITALADGIDEPTEQLLVTLGEPTGTTYGPTVTNPIKVKITDADPSPVQFNSTVVNRLEYKGTIVVTVTMANPTAATVTIPYTLAGTATYGEDYTAFPTGQLTIAPNKLSAKLEIRLIDDDLDEPTEKFTITLGAPTNAVLGSANVLTFGITDDD